MLLSMTEPSPLLADAFSASCRLPTNLFLGCLDTTGSTDGSEAVPSTSYLLLSGSIVRERVWLRLLGIVAQTFSEARLRKIGQSFLPRTITPTAKLIQMARSYHLHFERDE